MRPTSPVLWELAEGNFPRLSDTAARAKGSLKMAEGKHPLIVNPSRSNVAAERDSVDWASNDELTDSFGLGPSRGRKRVEDAIGLRLTV